MRPPRKPLPQRQFQQALRRIQWNAKVHEDERSLIYNSMIALVARVHDCIEPGKTYLQVANKLMTVFKMDPGMKRDLRAQIAAARKEQKRDKQAWAVMLKLDRKAL